MGTHGTISIRRKILDKDEVFVFHPTSDGRWVEGFMEANPNPISIDDLILDAVRFCSEQFEGGRYDDITRVNTFVEEFNPERNYADMTECSVYYDGKSWNHNYNEEENE